MKNEQAAGIELWLNPGGSGLDWLLDNKAYDFDKRIFYKYNISISVAKTITNILEIKLTTPYEKCISYAVPLSHQIREKAAKATTLINNNMCLNISWENKKVVLLLNNMAVESANPMLTRC